jgi:hypothetical protein
MMRTSADNLLSNPKYHGKKVSRKEFTKDEDKIELSQDEIVDEDEDDSDMDETDVEDDEDMDSEISFDEEDDNDDSDNEKGMAQDLFLQLRQIEKEEK